MYQRLSASDFGLSGHNMYAQSLKYETRGRGIVGCVNGSFFPHEFRKAESLRFTKIRTCLPRFGARVYTTGMGGCCSNRHTLSEAANKSQTRVRRDHGVFV